MRLTHKPRAPRELSADIPRYLEDVVLKCMEVDPVLRYQSVAEILADLDREQVGRSLTLRVQRAVGRRRAAPVGRGGAWPSWRPRAFTGPRATAAPRRRAGGPARCWRSCRSPTPPARRSWTGCAPGCRRCWSPTSRSRSMCARCRASASTACWSRPGSPASRASTSRRSSRSRSWRTPQSVLSGQFVESGGRLRLDLNLRKAGSGVSVPLKVEAATSEVFALVDQITTRIKEQLDLRRRRSAATPTGRSRRSRRPRSRRSTPTRPGWPSSAQGANQDAAPLLREATVKDANFAMAWSKLAEAQLNAGQHDEAGAAIERARALSEKAALPLAERYQIHATAALSRTTTRPRPRATASWRSCTPRTPTSS